MEIPERIWHLMAKTLNKEAAPAEKEELTRLLEQDESIQQQFDLLSHIWNEKGKGTDDEGNARKLILRIIDRAKTESDRAFENEANAERSRRQRRRGRRILVSTFSLVAISLAAWFFISNQSSRTANAKIIPDALVVNKGSRSRFLLPDGTTVWLNAGSTLHYENDFTGTTREVRLVGEAFFDVIKDPAKPFIVHTSDIDIRVLGTAFNIKSYPEDKNVETTLYRGLINVSRRNATDKSVISLLPNEKLILAKEAATEQTKLSLEEAAPAKVIPAIFTISHIDSTKKESERFETAWVYSRLEFRGENFEELALKLERWYNVSIVFTDESLKKLKFNGSFERETVEQAFYGLQAAEPFDYKIKGHEVFIGASE